MQFSDRIGRRMKLHDLHILMAVVQAGSMSKAARRPQYDPARHFQIDRGTGSVPLGVRLLDRNPQGVEPTKYGRALLDGGAAVFDDLHQAVKNIEFLADPTAGEVRIGCNPVLATSFVSAVVDRLSRRYPRIVFYVVAEQVEILHRELRERNVDLLVTSEIRPFCRTSDVEFEFLFDDSYVVVAGAQNPWVRRRRIELADLVNEPWALPPRESVIGSIVCGSVSRQRARLSTRDCGHQFPRDANQSPGDRALSRDFPDLRIEISHEAFGTQGLARRTANCPRAESELSR